MRNKTMGESMFEEIMTRGVGEICLILILFKYSPEAELRGFRAGPARCLSSIQPHIPSPQHVRLFLMQIPSRGLCSVLSADPLDWCMWPVHLSACVRGDKRTECYWVFCGDTKIHPPFLTPSSQPNPNPPPISPRSLAHLSAHCPPMLDLFY